MTNPNLDVKTVKGTLSSNTYIVTDRQTTVIIDAGAKPNLVKEALGDAAPDAIFLTHLHFDHITHKDDYAAEFNIPVQIASDEKEITVKTLTVKPILCPGHSHESVVYLIGDTLFTGDVLFHGTIGRTDLIPGGDKLMQGTLRKLLDIKFRTAYHGHGKPSDYTHQQQNIRNFMR